IQAIRDPHLQLPGVVFDPMLVQSRNNGSVVLYFGQSNLSEASEIMDRCRQFWQEQGLETETDGETVAGIDKQRKVVYSARGFPDKHTGGTTLVILRLAKDVQSLPVLEAGEAAEILPTLPRSKGNIESGIRGEPGYSMMFDVHAGPLKAYNVVYEELEKRGWEPFKNTDAFNDPGGTMIHGKMVCILQHTRYARGCQLMVSSHPEHGRGHSQVFISVF
ncbi:MAG: hypothetical protein ACOC2L_04530, partial [Candidatus Sumerlaeota bacterium]